MASNVPLCNVVMGNEEFYASSFNNLCEAQSVGSKYASSCVSLSLLLLLTVLFYMQYSAVGQTQNTMILLAGVVLLLCCTCSTFTSYRRRKAALNTLYTTGRPCLSAKNGTTLVRHPI